MLSKSMSIGGDAWWAYQHAANHNHTTTNTARRPPPPDTAHAAAARGAGKGREEMGKAKKTRKYAVVKKQISPKDPRL